PPHLAAFPTRRSSDLLAEGYPFVFGFTVYTKFESQEMARTGVLSMPGPDEDVVGGHAVLAVGYDDASETFIVRNSWGADWGQARSEEHTSELQSLTNL